MWVSFADETRGSGTSSEVEFGRQKTGAQGWTGGEGEKREESGIGRCRWVSVSADPDSELGESR